jgi:Rrf2 family nitric oxide-sensitive transcriptional repressor
MYLAMNADRRGTIREISDAYGISRAHLMKVVNLLTREGFVSAQRGPTGGLMLAVPAGKIRLGDVARKTEDDLALVECFRPDGACVLSPACALAPALDRALKAFLAALDEVTIADLVQRQQPLRRLLRKAS